MEKTIKLFVLIIIVVAYFFFFNILSIIDFDFSLPNNSSYSSTTSSEKVGVGDKVEARVFRDGYLWNIETVSYKDYKDSTIYFLGFIPVPLVRSNFSFFWIHVISGVLFFMAFLSIIFSNERGYYG